MLRSRPTGAGNRRSSMLSQQFLPAFAASSSLTGIFSVASSSPRYAPYPALLCLKGSELSCLQSWSVNHASLQSSPFASKLSNITLSSTLISSSFTPASPHNLRYKIFNDAISHFPTAPSPFSITLNKFPSPPLSSEPVRRVKRRQRSLSPSSSSPLVSAHPPPKSASFPVSTPAPASARARRHVRSMFARAREADRNGNVDGARTLLRGCLELDRRDAHSWLALARLEARTGGVNLRTDVLHQAGEGQIGGGRGVEVAREVFHEGLAECPQSVHLMQAWAVLELRRGDRDAARNLFERAAELDPANAYVCQAWGLMEQRMGNTEKARGLFRRTVSLNPHPEVCAAWAVLEAREGNLKMARSLFEEGLRNCTAASTRSGASIYRSWAEMEERFGDAPRARELLSRAIAMQPQMTEAYIALANLEARRGCTTRALELMTTAGNLSSRPPAAVFNAWAQLEWNRVERARELLERGHQLHPHDPALLQSLGILEERCGNNERAKALFKKSISVRATAPAYVAWALLEEREGNHDESEGAFEEALATDALHGPAYNAYGMMEARRGCLGKARDIYERGLRSFPSASVWHGYAQLELKLGRNPDRARELFQQGVMQTREDTTFIWHSWGMLELSQERVLEARKVFADAMRRYPRNSQVLVGAALAEAASCRRTRADESRARGFFKLAVAADPTHAHAWQTWGVFELRRGRPDAAQALFRRGLRLCPSHGALWQGWGVLETERGNFVKARKLFARGAEACPSHIHLLQAWACMEVRSGNISKARLLLDEAIGFDCHHGPVWNAYGLLEARHGTLAQARQMFTTGIKRSPDHAPLYRTFGETEVRAGNYDKARSLFREGLRIDPRHAPLYHALAKFEAMVGNVTALAALRQDAEKYFGSEDKAVSAIQRGREALVRDAAFSTKEGTDFQFGSDASAMEAALGARMFFEK